MNKRNRLIPLLVIVLALSVSATFAVGVGQPITAFEGDGHGNADYITASQLKDYLYFIASDEMRGRRTPSRGLDTVAKFLATNLSRWGLRPAGDDGSYFQQIELERHRVDSAATTVKINGQSFAYGDGFLASPTVAELSGPLVYVGHGWVIKAKEIDPYEGIDVAGKIMVIAGGGLPKGVTFADIRAGVRGEDWIQPLAYAVKNGALGVIVVPSFQTLSRWQRSLESAQQRGSVRVVAFEDQGNAEVPTITASVPMVSALFQGEERNATAIFNGVASREPGESFDLDAAKTVNISIAVDTDTVTTQNVVALLEGGEPELRSEYVAIGAHYDHVGVGSPVNGDSIYNGADDDGSGTTAVLAIAEAFSHGPRPKRSILFVWHCGEEVGLWGARYFTEHPTVPLDKIVAQLNIDMIGRSKAEGDTSRANRDLTGPNEIYLIGPKVMSDELGEIVEAVNRSYLDLGINHRYDDIDEPSRFFFRSDHFNYAHKGIPIAFFFDGVHADYHRPSDSPDKIDYQKMEKVARTIYATAWTLGNREGRPGLNQVLPEELQRWP
ncbi:MAG: M20/M25/M40 family metallo-hydrolase [Acidobacteriota bacterium]